MFRVIIDRDARKSLLKLPKSANLKILQSFRALAREPYLGKPLGGEYAGRYSMKVWPYRIIYQIMKAERIIQILDIGHRQGIYK